MLLIEHAHPDSTGAAPVVDQIISATRQHVYYLDPGPYLVWMAGIDDLGMPGDYVGPLRLMSGGCE